MRIPFPIRISLLHSSSFAVLLCAAQLVEGTPLYFSLYTFLFIVIATLAFNAAGGFSRPSGSYVFFYAVLVVILGLVVKVCVGEPADSNLYAPKTTMLVYVAGISAMYVSAWLAHRLVPKKSLLERMGANMDLDAASIGCIVVGVALYMWSAVANADASSVNDLIASNGTVLGAVNQLNRFLPLGILLGVTHTIRQSGGRRFLSLPVVFAALFMVVFYGILGTSKEGFFTPIFCVLVVAAAMRYRFTVTQVSVFFLGMIFVMTYIVPYIQLGKGASGDTFQSKVDFAMTQLTHLEATREEADFSGHSYAEDDDFEIHYYNESHGLFDRLQMISIDDALIDITDQGHVYGISPVLFDFMNLVPHFIWHDKPSVQQGNLYAHEIGEAHYQSGGQDDFTTGISLSPTADAYHEAKWYGVLLLAPALWFAAFFAMDWLCGDTRRSPWGLLAIAMCAHVAPEGMLGGPIYLMSFGFLAIYLASFLAVYVLPVVTTLLTGPRRAAMIAPPRRQRAESMPSPLKPIP